jgi:hypothetical protein
VPPHRLPPALHGRARRNLLTWLRGAFHKPATTDWLEHQKLEDKAVQDAIVDAFRRVQSQFAWQQKERRFVSLAATDELQTDFWRLVSAHPVTDPWDLIVLTRDDRHHGRGERDDRSRRARVLPRVHDAGSGTLEELGKGPPLTTADLLRTSPSCANRSSRSQRSSPCSDQRFELVEGHELLAYAAGLGIRTGTAPTRSSASEGAHRGPGDRGHLRRRAAGSREWRQVEDLAQQFDMGPDELLAVARRSRARRGIV